ncbi:MAG: diguanylate cyclase, partial [Oscillospiraceae bacterium]|nr:diguanylate cyclase [Oscillospiraceae bacterium]
MDIKQTISEILMESGIYASMYDLVRVVDAPKGRLLELKDRIVTETVTNCTDALCSSARCKNCTSIRAYYTGETSVKFEYVSGAVMLVMSVPVTLNDEKFVVELIKDITSSMTIDIEDANKSRSMEFAIARLNSMAQTDALTSLPNRQFINDKLPENIKSCLNNGDSLSVVLVDIDFFK